jgi:hypothetical protein
MPRMNQLRISGRTQSKTAKPPVIDNRTYPSTEEVARVLRVPADRVRQLKDLAAKRVSAAELVR